jgi:hypothetical protein
MLYTIRQASSIGVKPYASTAQPTRCQDATTEGQRYITKGIGDRSEQTPLSVPQVGLYESSNLIH